MRTAIASAALVALVAATPMPQAVTSAISPKTTAGAGCQSTLPGTFEIEVVKSSSSKAKRDTVLTLTLNNGILHDQDGRTGYIAANYQFQFDGPPQAGAIYTAGWSVCPGNLLALGSQQVFYQCLSGTFYNLYSQSTGAQCSPVNIEVINASSGSGAQPTGSGISAQPDGQPTETPVTQISDGQPQGPTGVPVTQISDGQPQGPTGVPVTQISDGQPQASTGVPVTQISDGQPQATTGVPVTQISDGQPQATTGVPVTQISDGQPQATTGVPVTQISDGQPQATTGVPVTQIPDGQPQATTAAYNAAPTHALGGVAALGAFVAAVVAL